MGENSETCSGSAHVRLFASVVYLIRARKTRLLRCKVSKYISYWRTSWGAFHRITISKTA